MAITFYNIVAPLPDELLISYIKRLCDLNGVSLSEVKQQSLENVTKRNTGYINTFDMWMNLDGFIGIDANEMLIEHTLLPLVQLYTTADKINAIADQALHINGYSKIFSSVKGQFKDVRICPECMHEELDKFGFFYYHMAHQVPSVHVCHRHGVPLNMVEFTHKKRFYLHDIENRAIPDSTPMHVRSEKELQYAQFVYKLLHTYKGTSGEIVLDQIKTAMQEKHMTWTDLQTRMKKNHTFELLPAPTRLKKSIEMIKDINENLLVVLFELGLKPDYCGNIEFIHDTITDMSEIAQKVLKERGEYTLINFTGVENSAKIRHDSCGMEFDVPRFSRFIGAPYCPVCSGRPQTASQFIAALKQRETDKYTITGKFPDARSKKIRLRHENCGMEFEAHIRDIMAGKRCPQCQYIPRFEALNKLTSQMTEEEYHISKAGMPGYVYLVKGDESMLIKKCMLIQELFRPTPSKIFSHRVSATPENKIRLTGSVAFLIYEHISSHYRAGDTFTYTEICQDSSIESTNWQKFLIELGVIKKAGRNKYIYTGKVVNDLAVFRRTKKKRTK